MEIPNIELYLKTLNSLESLDKPYLANETLENINRVFQDDLSSIEACVFTASALDLDDGIPNYVSNAAVNRRTSTSTPPTTKAFHLMQYIVVNYSSAAELLAHKFIPWCIAYLNRNVPNEAKADFIKVSKTFVQSCPCLKVNWRENIQALKSFIQREKKIIPTVQKAIFSLLGLICELHAEDAHPFQDWLFQQILQLMWQNEHAVSNSNRLWEACFNGLNGLLVNFPPPTDYISQIIYRYLREFSIMNSDGARNTANRSAMRVFIRHGSYFSGFVFEEYQHWHLNLLEWIKGQSPENRHVGITALTKYYKIIVGHLISVDPIKEELTFCYFTSHMEKRISGYVYELKDRLSSIGEFAKTYAKYSEEETLLRATGRIVDEVALKVELNPSLLGIELEALSKVYAAVNAAPDRDRLPRLGVSLIERFPEIDANFQEGCLNALEESFCTWFQCSEVEFHTYIEATVYQGLLRTCAHPIFADAQLLKGTHFSETVRCYKDFLAVWIHLLTVSRRSSGGDMNRKRFGTLIYNVFISTFLKIISKLDLRVNNLTHERSDLSLAMEGKNPEDFKIFVNIVDLFQDVILKSDLPLLLKWLPEIIEIVVKLSHKAPLVSGFYKIIAICFQVALLEDCIDYFDKQMPVIETFMEDVIKRLDSQKDDLLIASLRMILLAPTPLISRQLHLVSSVIITATRVGRGYTDLLGLAVDALERWHLEIPASDIDSLIDDVLPHISSILLTPISQKNDFDSNITNKTVSLTSSGQVRRKFTGPNDKKMLALQKQLILFMGKLEPSRCMKSLQPMPKTRLEGTSLTYLIPLPDIRPSLDLNSLIPRVMELALSSAERSTRITACELLYAIILLAVERTRQVNSNGQLMQQLLEASLTLSCDADKVIRDLFNPFVLQITRYFSGKEHIRSENSATLIEVLIDGITHPFDSGLRDFAAICLKEYVQWASKENPQDALINIRAVLMRLCDYTIHPDRIKRIGATVAFNLLYKVVRENEEYLNLYWLRLYYYFLCSLEMCKDEEDTHLVKAAVEHIMRPFMEQGKMFAVCPLERRIPPGFGGGTLRDVAIVSLKYCQSLNSSLRLISQKFVKNLVLQLGDTFKDFVTTNSDSDLFSCNLECENWENGCVASMDYARWLVDVEAITNDEITENLRIKAEALLEIYASTSFPCKTGLITTLSFFTLTADHLSLNAVNNIIALMTRENTIIDDTDVNIACRSFLNTLKQNSSLWSFFIEKFPDVSVEKLLELLSTKDFKKLNAFLYCLDVIRDVSDLYNSDFSGDTIIKSVFESLFEVIDWKVFCLPLNENQKICLERLVSLAITKELNVQLVLELLTVKHEVEDNGKKVTKGGFFFWNFADVLVPFLVKEYQTPSLFKLLQHNGFHLLMFLLKYLRDHRKDFNLEVRKTLVLRILHDWDEWVKLLTKEELKSLLEIMHQVQDVPYGCYKDVKSVGTWFFKKFGTLLRDYEFVAFFELLPQFTSPDDDDSGEKWSYLADIGRKELFGTMSVLKEETVKIVFERSLLCLKLTPNWTLVKFNAEFMTAKPIPLEEDIIKAAFIQVSRQSSPQWLKICSMLYKTIFFELEKEGMFDMTRILVEILKASSRDYIIIFFREHIVDIFSIVTGKLSARTELDLAKKIVANDLLQTLYAQTDHADRVKIEEDLRKREIFRKCIAKCEFTNYITRCNTESEKELLRRLNCSYANFLCTFVSYMEEEKRTDKVYRAVLFKNELWESVVPTSKEYNFTMEFDQLPKLEKVVTSLKNTKAADEPAAVDPTTYINSYSTTLFNSTLSEDVRNFDLSHATVVNSPISHSSRLVLVLEMDELNKHEIVPNMCAVIRLMIAEGNKCWMTNFLDTLEKSPSRNAKILILKIIYNLADELEPFSTQFAPAIIKTILDIFERKPVNYFVMDLVNTLITWHAVLPNERKQVTDLVRWFFDESHSPRRDVLRYTFKHVQNIVAQWKNFINPNVLFEFILVRTGLYPPNEELQNYKTLNLTWILLSNGLLHAEDKRIQSLVKWCLQVMSENKKNSSMAAETCGLALKNFQNTEIFPKLYKDICDAVKNVSPNQNKKSQVSCLYSIHRFYSDISSDFIPVLLEHAWHHRSALKEQSLELILSHLKTCGFQDDRASELTTFFAVFCGDVLNCNIKSAQELILKIILQVVNSLEDEIIFKIIPNIVKMSENKYSQLRTHACSVLSAICNKFETKPLTEIQKKSLEECKCILFDLIHDTNDAVQAICVKFWSKVISTSTKERLFFILTQLYTPQTDTVFLHNAVLLLLEVACLTPDYQMGIFRYPLKDCVYSDMKLLVNWQAQHVSLAPMFAPSLATELNRLHTEFPQESKLYKSLRDVAKTFENSLLFSPTISEFQQPTPLSAFVQRYGNDSKGPSSSRFQKHNAAATSAFFAKKASKTALVEKTSAEERIKIEDSAVTLFRSYRNGDYPDIMIQNNELIKIITGLAQKDSHFAKNVFVSLLNEIIKKDKDIKGMRDEISRGLNLIAKHSISDYSITLGAVFEIALTNEILLDSEEVLRSARASGLLAVGALLIERSLTNSISHEGPSSAKRRKGMKSFENDQWIRIAQLYYKTHDTDSVQGIFLDKLLVENAAKEAIVQESLMNWNSAAQSYEQVLNDDSAEKIHFYNQSYLTCLANLSDWKKIMDSVEGTVPSKQLWEDPWCSDVLLPWSFKSKMMVSFAEKSTAFQDYVKECIDDPEKSNTMSRFTDEQAIAYWLKEETAKSINSAYQSCMFSLKRWSSINQWDVQLKKTCLTHLQNVLEIQRVVDILSSRSQLSSIAKMVHGASKEEPNCRSDLVSWDIRLSLRRRLFLYLQEKETEASILENNLVSNYLSLANAAVEMENVSLTKRTLSETKKMVLNNTQNVRWRHIRSLTGILDVKNSPKTSDEKLKEYFDLWSKNENDASDIMDIEEGKELVAQMNRTTLKIISEMVGECQSAGMNPEAVCFSSKEQRNLIKNWLECAENTIAGLEVASERGEMHVQVAKFYKKYKDAQEHWSVVIKSLLKAMQCGNPEARELFAHIFNMEGIREDEINWLDLEEECAKVPTWMFLMWRHQMVAHLTSNPTKLLRSILLRIATEYPGSLSYPLRISKENFNDELKNNNLVKKLSTLALSNNVEETFIRAIAKIASPFLKMRYYLGNIMTCIGTTAEELKEIKSYLHELNNMCDSELCENYPTIIKLKSEMETLQEIDDINQIKRAVKNLIGTVNEAEKKTKLSKKLQNYSKWLSEFHWLNVDDILEVPGQYDGFSEPRIKNHVRIASFKSDVVVMNSKQKPIKLTMIGNNAKEYSFLVKFGEDLRQDERIQHVLSQMRRTLRARKATAEFELDGFAVIPITTALGLIEWVQSTRTLKELMNLPEAKIKKACEDNFNYLDPAVQLPLGKHRSAYLLKTDDQMLSGFALRVASFDRESLRNGFWRLSTCPEQFVGIRSNFARSLAVMNIAHWIIGVGDRHLENILVSTRTGRAIGIDFGMAFGFATQFLPLPELLPFRLTPQLVNVFSPFNESGWLKQTMVHSLRCLRDDPTVLLTMLEVFVLEPCLDWVKAAKTIAREQFDDDSSGICTLYQKNKIQAVKNKLEGENPVCGIEEDLRYGRENDACVPRQVEVLRGSADSIRRTLPYKGLSANQQVECLLDLATDPLVLAYTWSGWSPWL